MRVLKKRNPGKFHFTLIFFSPKKLARLFILKEVKLSLDGKMIKPLTLFPLPWIIDILAKTRCRMTTAITFSCQNDVDSRARTT